MHKLGNKLRKRWVSISLVIVAVAVMVFSTYQIYAQRVGLEEVKNQTQELSKQVEKLVGALPTPTTLPEPTVLPTSTPKPKAQNNQATKEKVFIPSFNFGNQDRQSLYEKQQQERVIEQQNKNIESICTGSGGYMFFGECRY